MVKSILIIFVFVFLSITSYFSYLYFVLINEKKIIQKEAIIKYEKKSEATKKDKKIVYKEIRYLPLFIENDLKEFGINTRNISEEDWRKYLLSIQKASIELISKYNEHGYSLLHYAIDYSDFKLLKYLINLGLDVEKKDKYGETVLSKAVRNSNIKLVEFLLNQTNNLDITVKYDNSTYDLLELALYNDDEKERDKIIKLLKDNGFAFNDIKYFDDLNTSENKKYLLELLSNININHKVNNTSSIFDLAILENQGDEVIEYFLDNDVNINAYSLKVLTKNKKISKKNIQRIVDNVVKTEGKINFSNLSMAITSYNFNLVEAMLNAGADLNEIDSFGRGAYDFINPPNRFVKEQTKDNKKKMKELLDKYNKNFN